SQPASRAQRWNQRVNSPTAMEGKVCRIQMPPSSCRLIAFWVFIPSTNASAPNLTTSEAILETVASSCGVAFGRMKSRQMLRVNRLAAAMDMIAAGTSAPMAIAANATPANQLGKTSRKRRGAASRLFVVLIPSAMAMKPSSATKASMSEYSGNATVLRRTVLRCFDARTPVTECGYMKRAIAEPSASVAYAQYDFADGRNANVGFVPAAFAAAAAWSPCALAAAKMWP